MSLCPGGPLFLRRPPSTPVYLFPCYLRKSYGANANLFVWNASGLSLHLLPSFHWKYGLSERGGNRFHLLALRKEMQRNYQHFYFFIITIIIIIVQFPVHIHDLSAFIITYFFILFLALFTSEASGGLMSSQLLRLFWTFDVAIRGMSALFFFFFLFYLPCDSGIWSLRSVT